MKVLLDEPRVFVTYGSASVFSGDDPYEADHEPDEVYAGQENGICGAAVPGLLQLTIGTHTGWVPVRVELHTGEPDVEDAWEEIVEVPFRPTRKAVHLLTTFDRRKELANIKVPTLVVAGSEDKTAPPAVMEKMASKIPAAEYVLLEGCGHLGPMDQPAQFNEALHSFLIGHGL